MKYRPKRQRMYPNPKVVPLGWWYSLPKALGEAYPHYFTHQTKKIEVLIHLRSVMRSKDPLLVALYIDEIRLFREYCDTTKPPYKRKRKREQHGIKKLTTAEKLFITGNM